MSSYSALWCPPLQTLSSLCLGPNTQVGPSFLPSWVLSLHSLDTNFFELHWLPMRCPSHLICVPTPLLQAILQCHPPQLSWIPSLYVGLPCLKILTPDDKPLSHTDIFLILLEHWGTAPICLRTLCPFHPPGALTACTWQYFLHPCIDNLTAQVFIVCARLPSCEDALLTKLKL